MHENLPVPEQMPEGKQRGGLTEGGSSERTSNEATPYPSE
jgi:hypothetical protein